MWLSREIEIIQLNISFFLFQQREGEQESTPAGFHRNQAILMPQ